MIQLYSPAPESIPVKTGKSPEKAAPSSTGDGRFEKALEQSRQVSRSENSPETDVRKAKRVSLRTEKDSKRSEKKSSAEDKAKSTESRAPAENKGQAQADPSALKDAAAEERGQTSKSALLALGTSKSTGKLEKQGLAAPLNGPGGSAGNADDAVQAYALRHSPAVQTEDADLVAGTAAEQTSGQGAADLSAADARGSEAAEKADAVLLQNGIALTGSGDKDAPASVKSSKLSKKAGSSSPKKDEGLKITVDDHRTSGAGERSPVLKKVEHASESNTLTLELSGSEEELPGMMLRADGDAGSSAKFSLQTAEESKGAALLDRQLRNKGTSELTKNIRFVLKDNKEGEIKLILKPEALGKVRINLNLNENNIVGKIIVENNSVRQVFMNNLADLTRALEDSGFNSAALDVSVGGGQSEGRGGFRDEKPVYFTDSALDDLEDMIPVVYDEGHSLSQINLVV